MSEARDRRAGSTRAARSEAGGLGTSGWTPRVAVVMVVVSLAALAGCGATTGPRDWGFEPVDTSGLGDDGVLALLAARAQPPSTTYAELSLALDGPEQSGVFDAVVVFRRPSELRMTAFRDALVETWPIFDVSISAEGFRMSWNEASPGEETRLAWSEGSLEELRQAHAALRPFALLRERLFAPGPRATEESTLERRGAEWLVRELDPGGVAIEWRVDPETLAVVGAELGGLEDGARPTVRYRSYGSFDGHRLPNGFELRDEASGIRVTGRVRYAEVDIELEDEDFLLDDGAGDAP